MAVVVGLIGVGLLVTVALSLFVRRHGESDRPRSGWTPTDEVFQDPGTDRTMRVWLDRTGERHYVPEAG
jgi:hypothetical protein